MLEHEGIHIIGITPDYATEEIRRSRRFSLVKGSEILGWLEQHKEVQQWIVIDDLDLHNEIIAQHQVKTDPSVGVTGEDIEKAIRLLEDTNMELFAKPGAGGIIEKNVDGTDYILVQERCKKDAKAEFGLLEIPAGKVREFENIYDCLRREIWEETGLIITYIEGEDQAVIYESNGYRVLSYTPFSSSQNIAGTYPIMVQTFICRAEGELRKESNETKNIRWISLHELKRRLEQDTDAFYPMHVVTLKKYIQMRLG